MTPVSIGQHQFSFFIKDFEITTMKENVRQKVVHLIKEIWMVILQEADKGYLYVLIPFVIHPTDSKYSLIKNLSEVDYKLKKTIANLFHRHFAIDLTYFDLTPAWSFSWNQENGFLNAKPQLKIDNQTDNVSAFYESLYLNPLCSDIEISVDGKNIIAHKIILTRCEFFKVLFSSSGQWQETNQQIIKIEECSKKIFLNFLYYVYTDKFISINQFEQLEEMITFADRMGCQSLINRCAFKLATYLPNYLEEIKRLAQMIHLPSLNSLCAWYEQRMLLVN